MGAFAGQYLWAEDHNMTIVEVDGVYTKPMVTDMIYLAVAQRCSFLITTANDTKKTYAVVGSMDTVHTTSSLPNSRLIEQCRPSLTSFCQP